MPEPTSHRVCQQRGSELMAGVSRQGAGVNEVIKVYKRGKAGTARAAGAGEIILASRWEEKEGESRTDPTYSITVPAFNTQPQLSAVEQVFLLQLRFKFLWGCFPLISPCCPFVHSSSTTEIPHISLLCLLCASVSSSMQ